MKKNYFKHNQKNELLHKRFAKILPWQLLILFLLFVPFAMSANNLPDTAIEADTIRNKVVNVNALNNVVVTPEFPNSFEEPKINVSVTTVTLKKKASVYTKKQFYKRSGGKDKIVKYTDQHGNELDATTAKRFLQEAKLKSPPDLKKDK